MPQLGETVTEGTILRWLVKVGDEVKEDDPILEISTDKVDTEVPSPLDCLNSKILFQQLLKISQMLLMKKGHLLAGCTN